MDVLEIPGYASAVVKERIIRDAAFLGITESIGPFEVVSMTLRHWVVLRTMNSPFLRGGTPGPIDVVDFLWLLSPQFSPHQTKFRKAFDRQCLEHFFPPKHSIWSAKKSHKLRCEQRMINAAKIIDAARDYIIETMQDRPPVQKSMSNGHEVDYYSDPAYFCACFGREFGWCQEEVLNMPLKRLFQYLNEMKKYHGSPVPLMNPSDSIKAAWMRGVNIKN